LDIRLSLYLVFPTYLRLSASDSGHPKHKSRQGQSKRSQSSPLRRKQSCSPLPRWRLRTRPVKSKLFSVISPGFNQNEEGAAASFLIYYVGW
jgi:hypothetical protein